MKNVFKIIWANKEYIAIAIIIFFVFRMLQKRMDFVSGKKEKPSKEKKQVLAKKGGAKILNKDLYRKVSNEIKKIKGVTVEPTFYIVKDVAKNLSLYDNFLNPDKSRSFLKEVMRLQSKAAVSALAHEYFLLTRKDINAIIRKMDNESISELTKYVNGLPTGISYNNQKI